MLRLFGEPSDVAADTDEEPESPLLMVVGINQSGQVLRSSVLPAADGALLSDLTVRNRLTGEHQFRVIRVNGQAEVFFNGHRIFLGPIDATPRVRFQLAVIGTKMKLHSLKLEELLPRKSASQ